MRVPPLFGACLETISQKTFYHTYWKTFSLVKADTDELREQAFRLRHEVFCSDEFQGLHCGMADDLEKDAYDDRAAHYLLRHNDTGDIAGVVRTIHADMDSDIFSFPLQEVCDHPFIHDQNTEKKITEISRLCMAKTFRQRPGDGRALPAYTNIMQHYHNEDVGVSYIRRRIPFAPLGLLHAAFESALANKSMDCVVAMDPSDFHTLRDLGIVYKVLGPRLSHYAGMQAVVFNIKTVLDHMMQDNKPCWEIVTDHGRLHSIANEIALENWSDTIFGQQTRDAIFVHAAQNQE
ncbi:MAG: PEP-CTERM/exosortase system-associated acyltransferase [Alphaproteobacteria bacterium]|jgi:N-acyl amino acid synthase of PEP-CTERM/exosortase system|nr:PEP-CTERM/exosortase system-associated acyltransferase [Alphaproteobacteria bacterium]MDP7222124.1 PEP-CTERM/exosortase system-associated acyltransferase [Alphaproteobacteria bacterium]